MTNITYNESKLKNLIDVLIKNRKDVDDEICPSCHSIKPVQSHCHCDDDD